MAEKHKFEEGDVVQLKSGGPNMTVDGASEVWCRCRWFDKDAKLQEENFKHDSLVLPPAQTAIEAQYGQE